MMETAHLQTLTVTALMSGKGTDVTLVMFTCMFTCRHCIHVHVHAAVCETDFCRNGGSCLYPNVNCSCWLISSGDTCDTLNYPLLAGSGAALLVTLLAILVAVLVIVTVIRKTKKTQLKDKR